MEHTMLANIEINQSSTVVWDIARYFWSGSDFSLKFYFVNKHNGNGLPETIINAKYRSVHEDL